MSMHEAERLAKAEGLQLLRSATRQTGFEGVTWRDRPKPYMVFVEHPSEKVAGRRDWTKRRQERVGDFYTAAEAALAYARALGPTRCAASIDAQQAHAKEAATQEEAHADRLERTLERNLPRPAVLPQRFGVEASAAAEQAGKRYAPPLLNQRSSKQKCPGPAHIDDSGTPWWVVEQLLASRSGPAGREFLVRWLDWGVEHDSWEAESNIMDARQIRAFDASGVSRSRARPLRSVERSDAQSAPSQHQPIGAWRARANARLHKQRIGPSHQATLPDYAGVRVGLEAASTDTLTAITSMELEVAKDTATLLTATAFAAVGAFSFVAPCDCGLGLFARTTLRAGQFVAEYAIC
eukprot:6987155-Prymnesium_polylepis.3